MQLIVVGILFFALGLLSSPQLPAWAQGGKAKDPDSLWGMSLKVRKDDEKDFTKDTLKFGVEVYKDANNGNLIYITQTGGIAVVPQK
jgi:hypothetical protein